MPLSLAMVWADVAEDTVSMSSHLERASATTKNRDGLAIPMGGVKQQLATSDALDTPHMSELDS